MSKVTVKRPKGNIMSEEQKKIWLNRSSKYNSQIQKKFSVYFTLKESQWLLEKVNIILYSCVGDIKHDNYGEKKLLCKSFLIINYLIISATMI